MNDKKPIKGWHNFISFFMCRFRRARGEFILRKFPNIRELKICDLGGSRHFWERLGINVPWKNITIYNISEAEVASMESLETDEIEVCIYDGVHIPVDDKYFDLLICNSVLEHVPQDQRKQLCSEMMRVSKAMFVQTPAKSFVIDPHFIMPLVHWLPKSKLGYFFVCISPWRLLSRPSKKIIDGYYYGTSLLTGKEVMNLFPGCKVLDESFLGLVKSYYVIKK